jgi:hypothetical protein
MKIDLKLCADSLGNAEEKLIAFLATSEGDIEERSKATVALSFVKKARQAILAE